ncbi:MAG TPA: DinB family protein [Tepidisphaeraceae bacterium]|nr:DinB family protein [Tepidisphaeraceae bacterium]
MTHAQESLSKLLEQSAGMLKWFVEDLKPAEWLHRPAPKANCAAWLVGHLALTDRRVLGMLGATDLPALPEGFEQRFARDESAPGATDFGDVSAILPVFEANRAMLIKTVAGMSDDAISRPLEKPNPRFGETIAHMLGFINLHVALHAGQITIIRRSLGYPPKV